MMPSVGGHTNPNRQRDSHPIPSRADPSDFRTPARIMRPRMMAPGRMIDNKRSCQRARLTGQRWPVRKDESATTGQADDRSDKWQMGGSSATQSAAIPLDYTP